MLFFFFGGVYNTSIVQSDGIQIGAAPRFAWAMQGGGGATHYSQATATLTTCLHFLFKLDPAPACRYHERYIFLYESKKH